MTGFEKRRSIFPPVGLVEIDSKEEAGFVLKQRIYTSDEGLTLGVGT
jgi:hypothetical protein